MAAVAEKESVDGAAVLEGRLAVQGGQQEGAEGRGCQAQQARAEHSPHPGTLRTDHRTPRKWVLWLLCGHVQPAVTRGGRQRAPARAPVRTLRTVLTRQAALLA